MLLRRGAICDYEMGSMHRHRNDNDSMKGRDKITGEIEVPSPDIRPGIDHCCQVS